MPNSAVPQFYTTRPAAGYITDWVSINPVANWSRISANSTIALVAVGSEPEGYVPGGGRCVKGSNTNHPTNFFSYALLAGTPFNFVGEDSLIEFPVYYDSDYINPGAAGIRFDMGSGGGLSDEYQKTFFPSVSNARKGWNIYSYPLQALINGSVNTANGLIKTGSPAIGAINYFRLQMNNASNTNARDLYIGPITYRRRGRTTVTFSFDDNLLTTYQNALPLLASYGWTATEFVIVSRPTDLPLSDVSGTAMNWNHIAYLRSQGWDIQCHSLTHINQKFSALTEKQYIDENITAIKQLRERGYPGTIFAYPGGGYTETTKEKLRAAGVTFGMALGADFDKVAWMWGSGDRYTVLRIGTDNGASNTTCLYYLDEAVRLGLNVHFYTHDLGASADAATYSNITNYTTLLNKVKQYERMGYLDVKNCAQYFNSAISGRNV